MPKFYTKSCFLIISFFLIFFPVSKVFSHSIVLDERDIEKRKYKKFVWVPYAFYTDSLGLAGGLAAGSTGYFQDQLGLYGAAMGSTNASYGLYLLEQKLKLPFTDRLFLDSNIYIARYTKYHKYIDGNSLFSNERAGSIHSSSDNYMEGDGWDDLAEFRFSYILPIGVGLEKPINTYILKQGILNEGSTCTGNWNPLVSGRTYFEVSPFYHWQDFSGSKPPVPDSNSNGLAFALEYDNTDFHMNPSKGSTQRVEIRRDFGTFQSTDTWTALEFSYNKYLSLGECKWFSQQVIALDFWTAFSPTWKYVEENGHLVSKHSTPDYYGAHLGGLYRMRGFEDRRFHDKAGLYYSAEYRVIPRWQPLKEINWLRPFEIDWWQFVFFVEAGSVTPEWNLIDLNEDLKLDAGISIRVMAFRSVCRLDIAFSEEEVSIAALIGHPF